MNQIKPFQIIVGGIFVVMAIAGVIAFSMAGNQGNQTLGEIVVWGTFPQEVMDKTLTTLSQTDKRFQNASYIEYAEDEFNQELTGALAAGRGPDLIILSSEELFETRDKITPIPASTISSRTFNSAYVNSAQLFYGIEGAYGIPFLVDPLVLYYNRTLLSDNGVAVPPSDWESLVSIAPFLSVVDANLNIVRSSVAFGEVENVKNARAILSLLFLQTGTPITRVDNTLLRSSLTQQGDVGGAPPAAAAVNFFSQFSNPARDIYSWNRVLPLDFDMFIRGDLVFYFGFASERSLIESANPNLVFEMASVPQPFAGGTRASFAVSYALSIPKGAKNQAGAYELANALTQGEVVESVGESVGMAPALRSLHTRFSNDVFSETYYPEALAARSWISPTPSVTNDIFSRMIESVATGRKSPESALSEAHQALDAALQ